MGTIAQTVAAQLFSDEASNVFGVFDGASVPELLEALRLNRPAYECLYRGELKPDLAQAAPYLIHMEASSKFSSWVFGSGWGKHRGIFALSTMDLGGLRQHFRRLLTVHDEETGKPMLFRYYDPRVLRVYLPTCNTDELKTLFGPVGTFVLEGEAPEIILRFQLASGLLVASRQELAKET